MTAFWIALAISTVAFVGGVIFVVIRALGAKKAVKSLTGAIEVEVERISLAGERTNAGVEAATKAFERLDGSLKRFATAKGRLHLVNEALSEAETFVKRARAFVPSK